MGVRWVSDECEMGVMLSQTSLAACSPTGYGRYIGVSRDMDVSIVRPYDVDRVSI